MKVLYRKSRYLLIPVFFFGFVFSGIAIYLLLYQADDIVKEFLSLRIIDSIELLRNADEDMRAVRSSHEKGALAECRAIALALELNRGKKDLPLIIAKLAKTLNVEMFSVTNEKGVIEISNELPAIGYDMNSKPQSREFMKLLTDPNAAVIQRPRPRGLDRELFQYVGIPRQDQKGIVSIGFSAKNYGPVESALSLRRRMQAMRIGERGFVLVVRDNRIVAAEDPSVLYKELKEIGISKLGEAGDFFYVKLHGRKYIASYETIGDIILIGMIPEADGFYFAWLCISIIVFLQISILALIWFSVYNNAVVPKSLQQSENNCN